MFGGSSAATAMNGRDDRVEADERLHRPIGNCPICYAVCVDSEIKHTGYMDVLALNPQSAKFLKIYLEIQWVDL